MKKIIFKSFLLLWTVLLACSCNDLLDEKAYDFVSPEQLGDSESAASQLVTGTYNTVITSFIAPGSYLYLTNMDCDYASGASWAFGNVGAGNPLGFWGIDHLWQGSYTLIHRANLSISKISAMNNLSQESKQDALAQLCFLKAWAYFNLVRSYGPVPIFRKSISEGEAMSQPRASVPDVYAHIIELLEQAEGMYSKDDAGFVVGHASSGAAKALLAKVYVTMASGAMAGVPIVVKGGDPNVFEPQPITHIAKTVAGYEGFDPVKYYALARDKAWEVINEYTLFDNYMDVWTIGNRNKGEHIWMAQAISGDKDFGNTICQDYVGIFKEDGTMDGNWYGMRDHWYLLFEEQDKRIVDGVIHRYASDGISNGKVIYNYYPRWYADKVENKEVYDSQGNAFDGTEVYHEGPGWTLAKLTKFTFVSDRKQEKSDFHFPLLRLPDIMLIYAEAVNELNAGPDAEAYRQINRIRTRANATPFSGMNQDEFRSAVLEERARELAYEADRRYDLFRWGIYLDVMNAIDMDEHNVTKRRLERNLLYPIPTSEVNSNDKIDVNNPGW
ncbi:RagB/SusD family nutrient uptake outer membrane protein [Bacteroides fragilis]|nr:RagB/SusD family nutrient uptake outer membrane protein [Bacteroides fragilis]